MRAVAQDPAAEAYPDGFQQAAAGDYQVSRDIRRCCRRRQPHPYAARGDGARIEIGKVRGIDRAVPRELEAGRCCQRDRRRQVAAAQREGLRRRGRADQRGKARQRVGRDVDRGRVLEWRMGYDGHVIDTQSLRLGGRRARRYAVVPGEVDRFARRQRLVDQRIGDRFGLCELVGGRVAALPGEVCGGHLAPGGVVGREEEAQREAVGVGSVPELASGIGDGEVADGIGAGVLVAPVEVAVLVSVAGGQPSCSAVRGVAAEVVDAADAGSHHGAREGACGGVGGVGPGDRPAGRRGRKRAAGVDAPGGGECGFCGGAQCVEVFRRDRDGCGAAGQRQARQKGGAPVNDESGPLSFHKPLLHHPRTMKRQGGRGRLRHSSATRQCACDCIFTDPCDLVNVNPLF